MLFHIKSDQTRGSILMLSNGSTEIGVALDYGIRIVHLSCSGMDNLLYRQPNDLSDGYTTDEGWRLYGGHRFWLAPEGSWSTFPDNQAVTYKILSDGAEFVQQIDEWHHVVKFLRIRFRDDGAIDLIHTIKNVGHQVLHASLWGITTFAGGASATVSFEGSQPPDDLTPRRVLALWADTNLGDPRISFQKDCIQIKHTPLEEFFKIGVFSKQGCCVLENLNQRLTIQSEPHSIEHLPDHGCNIEVFMDKNFLELETLGMLKSIAPGRYASHTETWYVIPTS